MKIGHFFTLLLLLPVIAIAQDEAKLNAIAMGCSPDFVDEAFDVQSSNLDFANLIYQNKEWVAVVPITQECWLGLIPHLTAKIDEETLDASANEYFELLLTLPELDSGTVDAIEAAYLRYGFDRQNYSADYFSVLSALNIDLVDDLSPRFLNESFDTSKLASFHFHRYLLFQGDERALAIIQRNLENVRHDPTKLVDLISHLESAKNKSLIPILSSYIGDCRQGDGLWGEGTGSSPHQAAVFAIALAENGNEEDAYAAVTQQENIAQAEGLNPCES